MVANSYNFDADLESIAARVGSINDINRDLSGSGPAAMTLATLLLVQAVRDLASDLRERTY